MPTKLASNGLSGRGHNWKQVGVDAAAGGAIAYFAAPMIIPEIQNQYAQLPFIGSVSGPVAFAASVAAGTLVSEIASSYVIPYIPVIGGDTAAMVVPPLIGGLSASAAYGYTTGYNPAGLAKSTAVGAVSQMAGNYVGGLWKM
jgi:hypothetical protein